MGFWGGLTLSMVTVIGINYFRDYLNSAQAQQEFESYCLPLATLAVLSMYNIILDRKLRRRKYQGELSELEKSLD